LNEQCSNRADIAPAVIMALGLFIAALPLLRGRALWVWYAAVVCRAPLAVATADRCRYHIRLWRFLYITAPSFYTLRGPCLAERVVATG